MPPPGYLAACAAICRRHDGVRPDGVILGKALGGGLLPSAFLADEVVMQVFPPGDHGSTFRGNPLACQVALNALDLLEEEELIKIPLYWANFCSLGCTN